MKPVERRPIGRKLTSIRRLPGHFAAYTRGKSRNIITESETLMAEYALNWELPGVYSRS